MIKVIWAAHRKPGMVDAAFYHHWRDVHGPLGARCTTMRRYIQHHTLSEARDGGDPVPTHDGASIAWFDDVSSMLASFASPAWEALRQDSPNLFDPGRAMDVVIANERVVVDGEATPGMIKFIAIARKHPSLSLEEFQQRWYEDHGERWSRIPGLRRYIQNHRVTEIDDPDEISRRMTHDGWSEDWFDDLDSLRRALASSERRAMADHSAQLFDRPMSYVVAREVPIVP